MATSSGGHSAMNRGTAGGRRDRRWRPSLPAAMIELLNVRWPELRGGPSPRSCPVCDVHIRARDLAVRHGGELYHPACARGRWEGA